MSARIEHVLLDAYEAAAGDPARVPAHDRHLIGPLWTAVDELLLDLHMMKHGYTTDGYDRHVERELVKLCADASVVQRLRDLRI